MKSLEDTWTGEEVRKALSNNKSLEELEKFTKFCWDNPELKFWQALSVWINKNVFTSDLPAISVVSELPELEDMWNK